MVMMMTMMIMMMVVVVVIMIIIKAITMFAPEPESSYKVEAENFGFTN